MTIFSNKSLFNTHFLYLILIFLFSFFINFYYAKFGSFPIDTFLHYDPAFRILNNDFPVRDYWIVSGFIIDFFQSFFFKILGVNWFAYTFHSSIFNFLISAFSYYFFISFGAGRYKSLLYTLSFATLAYTISGTPFVDHHATFFLLIATYLIVQVLKFPKKNYFWVFIIMLFFISFLSKQAPTTYVIFSQGAILLYFFIKRKRSNDVKIIFFSLVSFLILFLLILIYLKIDFKLFYTQYLDYPRTIGFDRYDKFTKSFEIFFNQYKFLFLPIIILLIIKFKKAKNKKFDIPLEEVIMFLVMIAFSMSLLFHQIMTRNQIFIYFLIPIFCLLLDIEIKNFNIKYKKYFSIILIVFTIFVTLKYHYRFNETRKFHELEKVDLGKSIPALKIHESLSGLNWITPRFKDEPHKEIIILSQTKNRIEKINHEIMLITHYLFLDSITEKNLNSPNRTFTLDGASVPLQNHRLYPYYKNFLTQKIEKKNIKEIYFLKHEKISKRIITDYFSKNCYDLREDELFFIIKIKCLN